MRRTVDRTGEERIMCCGMKATIIKYNSYRDFDIEFEDGCIVHCNYYGNFKAGQIKNPNIPISDYKKSRQKETGRVGQKRLMKCGLYAEIIEYKSCTDITVRFEDGVVVGPVTYDQFVSNIVHPDYDKRFKAREKVKRYMSEGRTETRGCKTVDSSERIGITNVQKYGHNATVIRYNGCCDVDVRFDDGSELHGVKYFEFLQGSLISPNNGKRSNRLDDRLGEKRVMNCGEEATIIRYGNANDIDIRFKDGTVVNNIRYNKFANGMISRKILERRKNKKNSDK